MCMIVFLCWLDDLFEHLILLKNLIQNKLKCLISLRFILVYVKNFIFGYVQKQYEKMKEIWLSPMTKAPTPAEMSKEQIENINNATKKVDYTAVADRLRTVSWSSYGHPTGVVNLVYGPTFPLPATAV